VSNAGRKIDLKAIAANVPLYRDHWNRHGIGLSRGPIDLLQIPLLSKTEFRAAGIRGRLDARFAGTDHTVESTSGSSGEPVEIRIDAASRRRRQWRFLKALLAAGYRPGNKLWILSTHRSSRMNRILRWRHLDLRAHEEALAARYQSERPNVLYGPLSALLSLSHGLPNSSATHRRPHALITTAEQLKPSDQRQLTDAFGCTASDFYGMTETGLLAYRNAGERHYRMAADDVFAEFLPAEADPDLERLVITTLRPCAMPLIRYDTGDLVRRDHGYPGVPIVEFIGREIDCVRLPSGRLISPYRLTLALETVPDINRYQIVQRADFSIDLLINSHLDDTTGLYARARAAVLRAIGADLQVRLEPMPQLYTPSPEKFRPVQSYAIAPPR